ncbi:MAG: hypothetical protein KDI37_15305, partial [Xanthomonadales bacterium]|nr:hypothetical protein [Xanthomonadales bacterium]
MHLLIHTLRHLRPVQIYRRPWTRLIRPRPRLAPPPVLRHWRGDWSGAAARKPSILNLRRIRLLEVEHELAVADDWQAPDHSDLFRYNLHYFDDLNALGARDRREWHSALIERWIAENPPGKGVGWAPYPTSLRMVNWIKAALSGFELPAEAVHSLAVQGRWLERRLEWHLLGNHLFANAKALVFAGCYFEGSEADGWLGTGLRILAR